jgi:hypothetical protein
MKRLIRCIVTRRKEQPRERWFTLAALGGNIQALERTYAGTIELADPSLTDAEAKSISHNFPYVTVDSLEKVNPLLVNEVYNFVSVKEVMDQSIAYMTEGTLNPREETELRALLDAANVKHGRVKRIEKLREMVAELS